MGSWSVKSQPRPQGFSRPTHFLREKPWGRGWSSPSNFLSCLIHDSVGSRAYTLRTRMEMNKFFWDYFKNFGRFLEKIYLFLTPRKTDGRVPSQQGAPTTCDLTYWEVS